tara:strand:+ start:224 stop:679 length:456 start_codon:yes stop_codon:yes gene_type:complete
MIEKKRGQKLCEKCNTPNGVRAYECKECDTPFKMKKYRKGNKKKQVEDHRTLNKGDLIRVVGGSGCHYMDENGDRHYFTDRGKYLVSSTNRDGILTHGKHGFQYIYMGKRKPSKLSNNTYWDRHKIILLKDADPSVRHSVYGSPKRSKSQA